MAMNKLVVFGLIAAIAGVASAKTTKSNAAPWWTHGTPGFAYDCSSKADGNYPHPTKCTHYVACVAQTHAYEMVCALSQDGNPLHYVASSGPDPTTSRCDYPDVAGCEANGDDTTTTIAPPPSPGGECNPYECKQEGDCRSFRVCENGRWSDLRTCDEDLFWNPAANVTFGGSCDFFVLLPEKTKEEYRSDRECIPPCEWWSDGECSETYWYREPFNNSTLRDREHQFRCSADPTGNSANNLVFNPVKLTCDRRANVAGCP